MGRRSEQTLLQKKRQADGEQAQERMLINSLNTNQNAKTITPHTCENGDCPNDKNQQVLDRTQCMDPCKLLVLQPRLAQIEMGAAILESNLKTDSSKKFKGEHW